MSQLISISEAADSLGVKPAEVSRLVDQGHLRAVVLVDASSVAEAKEQS